MPLGLLDRQRMQAAQQLDPGVRAQRLEEAAVHAGKINRPFARHAAYRIRTGRLTPPSYRQAISSGYAVNGGEVNGYQPISSPTVSIHHPPLRPRNMMAAVSVVFVRHDGEIRRIETDCSPTAFPRIHATRCLEVNLY
jgi:hypothetical protein